MGPDLPIPDEGGYENIKLSTEEEVYDKKTQEKVPFFDKVHKYINNKWNEINKNNYVFTDIYSRKLLSDNYVDMNKNKLFNYLIQAYETESNIKTIIEINNYLLDKHTKLVLYGYDSFLFDFSKRDGVNVLTEIKDILERNGHMVKTKMGFNYGEMTDISERL